VFDARVPFEIIVFYFNYSAACVRQIHRRGSYGVQRTRFRVNSVFRRPQVPTVQGYESFAALYSAGTHGQRDGGWVGRDARVFLHMAETILPDLGATLCNNVVRVYLRVRRSKPNRVAPNKRKTGRPKIRVQTGR